MNVLFLAAPFRDFRRSDDKCGGLEPYNINTTWNVFRDMKLLFMKQADKSYLPKRLAEGMNFFPVIAVERGYMDIIDRLRVEAAWWLVASEGNVKVAIVLAIDREKEKIVFEQWKLVVGDDGKSVPARTQEVVITRSGDGEVQVTGAPFTIQFHDLCLYVPESEDEEDLVYTAAHLKEIAQLVWGFQQEGIL